MDSGVVKNLIFGSFIYVVPVKESNRAMRAMGIHCELK